MTWTGPLLLPFFPTPPLIVQQPVIEYLFYIFILIIFHHLFVNSLSTTSLYSNLDEISRRVFGRSLTHWSSLARLSGVPSGTVQFSSNHPPFHYQQLTIVYYAHLINLTATTTNKHYSKLFNSSHFIFQINITYWSSNTRLFHLHLQFWSPSNSLIGLLVIGIFSEQQMN